MLDVLAVGQAVEAVRGADRAVATCSGRPAVTANMSEVSSDVRRPRRRSAVAHESAPRSPSWASMPSASALAIRRSCSASSTVVASSTSMHRDVVAHGVAAAQPRVVEAVLVGEVQQRSLVLGAGQHLEQQRVQRHGTSFRLCPVGPTRASGHGQPAVELVRPARRTSATCRRSRPRSRLDVEAQQRFGVGRPQVEPPVPVVDGEAVGAVDGRPLGRRSARPPPRPTPAGSATSVLISPESAYRRYGASSSDRGLPRRDMHLEHHQGGDDPRVGPVVVPEVVVPRVLAAEDGPGLGHHLLDEGVSDPGAHRRARRLASMVSGTTLEQMRL